MPVEASGVKVGHCYASTDGQQFKVTALVEGRVHFETLDGSGAGSSGNGFGGEPELEVFRRRLHAEVPCPEMGRSIPSQAEGDRGRDTGMDQPVPSQAEGEP